MIEPDTIFALSSGAPPAAIAIVRLSGPAAGAALSALAGDIPEPRRATLRAVRSGEGALLDRALLLWFPGPDSATGEDLAEFHVHGGRAVVNAVLAALAQAPGCRPARPGEFTRRAFANGRIDLAQAEGLADLLAAETEYQRRHAIRGAEGALGRAAAEWRARLVALAAGVEAELDFADESDVAVRLRDPRPALLAIAEELAAMRSAPSTDRLRDGVRVVIAGPPNSGKSSLLNALAGRDAAIVSPVAGTTRDRIEVSLAFDGLPLLLIDTAGLHEARDAIERIGIDRANEAVAGADLLLWMGPPDAVPAAPRRIVIHGRCDLPGRETLPLGADVATSIHGDGLRDLRAMLGSALTKLIPGEDMSATNARQREALCTCERSLRTAAETADLECLAEDLRSALAALDMTDGRAAGESVIDAVFERFCLGK